VLLYSVSGVESTASSNTNQEHQMAVYRITRFAASDMGKVGEFTNNMRDALEGIGADFIDLISYGNGKGVVIAKYPDQTAMDAATDTARKVFADLIEAGIVDADSVHPHTGEVFNSF
jgi:hypothetical protein